MTPQSLPSPIRFSDLGLEARLSSLLTRAHFNTPTPIQAQAIPLVLEGKDVIGIAQTGTGKTLAFGLPLIQHLSQTSGQALIIVPTRELAIQAQESLQMFTQPLGWRIAVLIGGAAMSPQCEILRRQPRVIIATPGRLIDHLQQKTVRLDRVNILVLDEADRMLDMGFAPQVQTILKSVPTERQTMLFSATMPGEIRRIVHTYMKQPVTIEIARAGTTAAQVSQEVVFVKKEEKVRLLQALLLEYTGTVLVFTRTKIGAKRLARQLQELGIPTAEIHANRSLAQRRQAIFGFKSGHFRILVATDIAARGIDVTGIQLVVNFDLPDHHEDYVHRIGRTGRADRSGHAISFALPEQRRDIREIERLIQMRLSIRTLPVDLPPLVKAQRPSSVAATFFAPRPKTFGRQRSSRTHSRSRFRKRSYSASVV